MTSNYKEQRRWNAVVNRLRDEHRIEAVVLSPSEGGGIMIISYGTAYHFKIVWIEVGCRGKGTGPFMMSRVIYERQDADRPSDHSCGDEVCTFFEGDIDHVADAIAEVISDGFKQCF